MHQCMQLMIFKWAYKDMDMIVHDHIRQQIVTPLVEILDRRDHNVSLLGSERRLSLGQTPRSEIDR